MLALPLKFKPFWKRSGPGLKDTLFLIDLGGFKVSGGVALESEGGWRLLSRASGIFPAGAMRLGAVADIQLVAETIKRVHESATLQAGKRPSEALLSLSGQWARGLTTVVRLGRLPAESLISEKEWGQVSSRVKETALGEAASVLSSETGTGDLAVVELSGRVSQIMVDGAPVTNPLRFSGKTIEVSYYGVYLPRRLAEVLGETAGRAGLRVSRFTHSSLYLPFVLKDEQLSELSAIFIDVGGQVTTLTLLHEGQVLESRSFSLGGEDFTRSISEAFNLSLIRAEEMKTRFASLNEEEKGRLLWATSDLLNAWLSGLKTILSEVKGLSRLPHRFYLLGGGALFLPLEEGLRGESLSSLRLAFPKEVINWEMRHSQVGIEGLLVVLTQPV